MSTLLEFHPLANLFPMMEGAEFDAFAADVAANGIREPIVLLEGKILDGRNRYRAAIAADILHPDLAPHARWEFVHFGDEGLDGVGGGDPLAYVISMNLRRRHLDESQRAMVAARLANIGHGGARAPAGGPEQAANLPVALSQSIAGDMLNVSERSVRTARAVIADGAPELVAAVESGRVAVSAAADLSKLPIEEQRRVIESANPKALNAVIRRVRDEKQLIKKERRVERERDLGTKQRLLPDKKYGVIYADPEWEFETYSADTGMDRSAANHYPTTPTNDIILRPVGTIAAPDSVLGLWTTAAMLKAGIRVMEGWGFVYKTHIIWLKDRIGTGYWFRSKHEILLIGTRGNIPAPAMGDQWESVIIAPVGRHSEKPEIFAEMLEAYYPNLPKIELNARRARPGWDAWGLEAPDGEAALTLDPVQSTEPAELKMLGCIDAGIGVDGPLVDRLVAEGLVRRDDRGLHTTMLGGMRLLVLQKRINSASASDGGMRIREAPP